MKLQAGPEDRGQRLDVYLSKSLPGTTRSQVQNLNRAGAIRVDGRVEKDGFKLRGTESISVEAPPAKSPPIPAEPIPLQVHFQDADLAIIEKPAGLVVHPGSGNTRGTLVDALRSRFGSLSDLGGAGRPGIVHRLDKWTSGLLIVARNNVVHARLARMFEERRIQKTYVALVHGKMRQPSGRIDLGIGRHPSVRVRMSAHARKSRTALTEYRVCEEVDGYSLLEIALRTGRTHQIRVHLSAVGHPVVGDSLYGERKESEFARKHGALGRYFLHATRLEFEHPFSGVRLCVESSLPSELVAILDRLKRPADTIY